MRLLRFVVLPVILAGLLLLAGGRDANAAEPIFFYPEDLGQIELRTSVSLTLQVKLGPEDPQYESTIITISIGGTTFQNESLFTSQGAIFAVGFGATQTMLDACVNGGGYMVLEMRAVAGSEPTVVLASLTKDIPCQVLISPALATPIQDRVCGLDNDTISGLDSQPSGVHVDAGVWVNGSRTVTLSEAVGYAWLIPSSPQVFPFADAGHCEITSSLVQPAIEHVCGVGNDMITPSVVQPEGVITLPIVSEWINGRASLTYSPMPGYVFANGIDSVIWVDEIDNPCETDPIIPPSLIHICGIENDEITIPLLPDGVGGDTSGDWVNGVFIVNIWALDGWMLPEDTPIRFELVDPGNCVVEGLTAPIHTAVCGNNNDLVDVSDAPENVLVMNDGIWNSDSTWKVTYTPAEHYQLPAGIDHTYAFEDEGDCIVTPIAPGAPTSVCGPNNDVVVMPDQPDGVIVTDTGWVGNERTFGVSPASNYAFHKVTPRFFTAIDENIPCVVDPVGVTVTVVFETSNGGSIEGASFQLYAPVASQASNQEPYAIGVIGPGNIVVFYELVAGKYRLATSPSGYEPVDAVLTVNDDAPAQEVTIEVTALAVPSTPSPTPAPTPASTAAPTKTPADPAPTAAITGLPKTGAGTIGGSSMIGLAVVIASAMVIGVAGTSRRSRS